MSWDFFLYNSIFLTSGHQTKNMRGNKITTCSHNNRCRLDQICADRCSSNLILKSHSQSHHWCVNVYPYLNHQIQVHTLQHPRVCNLSFSGCCGTAYSRMKPMCCILHKLYFTQKNQWLNASPDCTHACTDLQRSHTVSKMTATLTYTTWCIRTTDSIIHRFRKEWLLITKKILIDQANFQVNINSSTMLQYHIHHKTRMTAYTLSGKQSH